MQIVEASWEVIDVLSPDRIMQKLERIGRVSHKSEDKITPESADRFIAARIKEGHESIIEHENITVKFTCSRKTSHQLVRHRLASFTQESTRYNNYSREFIVVAPPYWTKKSAQYQDWILAMEWAEVAYQNLIRGEHFGGGQCSPEEAALVLPHSIKTEIYVTANLREWRHIFKMRCAPGADLEIRNLMTGLRGLLATILPVIFGEL